MTHSTESNQVGIDIFALLAPKLLVMDVQILPGATELASPAIAAQYLSSELVVWFGMPHLLPSSWDSC